MATVMHRINLKRLSPTVEACDLVAAGGIAASTVARHDKTRVPTRLAPIGILGNGDGQPLNLADCALPQAHTSRPRPLTLAVVGTSMNAGKTTTAAHLIKGLVAAGLKVGAAKITGTGAGPDVWLMLDAGADAVLDFVDAGYASTYRVPLAELQSIATILISRLHQAGVDAIVLEIADGLYQAETAALLSPATSSSRRADLCGQRCHGSLWRDRLAPPARAARVCD